ncbi:SusC/RagA family TonB-linked outer membrane protein [Wenyingzhuangia aestuarii]|uniref:SusC/RagA family TonB-linked outer membrane protein n=1 Tax=Wenyingzhuangia aestuarii TaxID=1647582 RepID=UPI001FD7D8B3|nr:TonB-dependent receptor [Wenyingzhuangia aestuarii]NJB82540.1 TonB-linked SusC/RagA family outer membrane protein [Wenyingzhuangia aestuarii]
MAQKKTITGIVSGDGMTLPGVNIVIKGTNLGSTTDFDGKFKIAVESEKILQFSYLGFKTKEIKIGNKTDLQVTLVSDISSLDEVVVVGYGSQKKKEVTGAVTKIQQEDLSKTATPDVASALQGQVAGVNVVASSGDPGATANITIRGLTSVNGSNSPLYVVDGIPYEDDPKLSMEEIESFDILKDDASAAIYGTRGAAGVILITTKKGQKGTMKMSLNSFYGIQSITSGVPLLNSQNLYYVRFLRAQAQNNTTYGNTWTSAEQGPHRLSLNSNIVDVVENNYAPIQSHSLRVSGGKSGLLYSFTGTYFNQEGVVIKSGYDRINLRSNVEFKKGNWKVSTITGFRLEETQHSPYGLLLDANSYFAYQPQLNLGTDIFNNAGDADSSEAANLGRIGRKFIREDDTEARTFDTNIKIKYNFSKKLNYMMRVGALYGNSNRITINPDFKVYNSLGELVPTERSSIRNTSMSRKKLSFENILNYTQKIGNHELKLLGVYSREYYEYSQFYAQKHDVANNDITVINGATADPVVASGTTRYDMDRTNTLVGMLGRLQYNYAGKYLLSASLRRDGSSRFVKQPWGLFPSVSLGWNVSDENFWTPIKDVVGNFKLRASRGTTGNQGIQDYSFDSVIVLENDYLFGAGDNQNLQLGAIQTTYANPNVKWETSVSNNFGLDMSLFRNKFQFTADIYKSNKRDMLLPVLTPPSSGGGSNSQVVLNVGDMENSGLELALNYKQRFGKLNIRTGLTYTKNNNKITKMGGENTMLALPNSKVSDIGAGEDLVSFVAEGYEAGSFFLIKTDGLVTTDEELLEYQKIMPTAKLGDLRYIDAITVDTNGDGIADAGDGTINEDDRQYSGSGIPTFEMGWNFNAGYKNFDFSMQWYGSFGAEILNGSKAYTYKKANHQDLVYQWSPQNPTSTIPVNRGDSHENYRGQTDFWLEDGSFIRLRNITLGYTFPKKSIEKLNISKLRMYVAAQNPLTFTKYTGYDPEVGNNGLSTRGIDKGTYPVSSQLRAGLQLNF